MQKAAETKSTRLDRYVGKRIRARRRERGHSLRVVADKIGVCFQLLSSYENGKTRITVSRLFDLSVELDVPMNYFYDGFQDCEKGGR